MATTIDGAGGIPSPEQMKFFAALQKYTEEAAKRMHPDLDGQFLSFQEATESRIRSLGEDPWVDHAALNARPDIATPGSRHKFVVIGAGFGGLIVAVRLLQSGLAKSASDIILLDRAGGFGGTWYWNRYPGLQCDVESYTYMPFLEETGYVPTMRYSSGEEIRLHADRVAQHFGVADRAFFRANPTTARWDENKQVWLLDLTESRGPDEPSRSFQIEAEYIFAASGIFPFPQVPRIKDLEKFQGKMFHTSRWDYSVTGGSPADQTLTGLEGKRVGILGTGATAIQAVPQLAKYAKELYVFQRTPSHVFPRDQRPTDAEEFKKKIANKKGWQLERTRNFNSILTGVTGIPNMIDDAWTSLKAYHAAVGSPNYSFITPTPEAMTAHVMAFQQIDFPFAESARARVDQLVEDSATAETLKGWYPTWCKRPTFHDSYLQTFNQPNVHLVDTGPLGISSAIPDGFVVDGKEYGLDVLILSTGNRSPLQEDGNVAIRAGLDIYGRNGQSLTDKWRTQGATTLHGMFISGFPNMFFQSTIQSAAAVNYLYAIDQWVEHQLGVLTLAAQRTPGSRPIVEPTTEGEETWAQSMMAHGAYYAALGACTPSYVTASGAFSKMPEDPVEMMKKARMSAWSWGLEKYAAFLREFREEGSLKGFAVTPATA